MTILLPMQSNVQSNRLRLDISRGSSVQPIITVLRRQEVMIGMWLCEQCPEQTHNLCYTEMEQDFKLARRE